MQNVAEIRRHDQLNQMLQLVVLQTGSARLVDALREGQMNVKDVWSRHQLPVSDSHAAGPHPHRGQVLAVLCPE